MVNETGKVTGIPQGGEEENFDSYEKLLDQYGARKFAEGEVMKGTVLKIRHFSDNVASTSFMMRTVPSCLRTATE